MLNKMATSNEFNLFEIKKLLSPNFLGIVFNTKL